MVEVVLASERAFHGRVYDVRVDTVRLPNGATTRRDVVVHPGAVVIAAVDADGSVLLERQYRGALRQVICELPAGTLDPGEPPEACARRELAEETGYRADHWDHLGGFYAAPGFCTEYLHAFLATGLTPGTSAVEEDEQIALLRVPLAEALALVRRGEICDAKSIVTLYWAAERLAGRSQPDGV
ncbi:MAG: NUDIX hydrolase [Chloroflexi bacterium]|nr:NUDIX hydrolase [Chloroflexota bacterium]